MTDTITPPPPWVEPIRSFAEEAPLFLAVPATELVDAFPLRHSHVRLALFLLCEAAEALTKTLAVVAAADLAAEGRLDPKTAQSANRLLSVPTFGSWWGFLSGVVKGDKTKRGTRTLPELPALVGVMDKVLFAQPAPGTGREWSSIIGVRNPLAHGGGIDPVLAVRLLDTWGPRLAEVLGHCSFFAEMTWWARDPTGFVSLNGPVARPPPGSPSDAVRNALEVGDIAVARGESVTLLSPLGRRSALRDDDRLLSQLYVRCGDVGLIYSLIGSDEALQAESDAATRERFDTLFGLHEIRRRAAEAGFSERGFDREFEDGAMGFIGRGAAVDELWNTVVGRQGGIVFVSGPAGMGKSRLVARVALDLIEEFAERRALGTSNEFVIPYRFVHKDRGCAPLPFLRWLVERVGRLNGQERTLTPDQEIHQLLDIAASMLTNSPVDRIVLVLDGLDELARGFPRFVSDLLRRLAQLPRLLVLAASRPERDILSTMSALGATLPWADGLPPMKEVEIREMLVTLLPTVSKRLLASDEFQDGAVRNAFVRAVEERAQGVPLFVDLLVQATHQAGFSLDRFSKTHWLPQNIEGFFKGLVQEGGTFSGDRAYYTQPVGVLLALAREPLSLPEIAAIMTADLSPEEREDMMARSGVDPVADQLFQAEQVLRELGGLLRVATDDGGTRRYRLLHDELTAFVRRDPAFTRVTAKARAWLTSQARAPTGAAARYLFANGIAHLLDSTVDDARAVALAAGCLSDIDYQVARLQALAPFGGDAGIREDWNLILDRGAVTDPQHRDWYHFWSTDGTHLAAGPGRDAAREFIEMALQYAPDTVVGAAATPFLPEEYRDGR